MQVITPAKGGAANPRRPLVLPALMLRRAYTSGIGTGFSPE